MQSHQAGPNLSCGWPNFTAVRPMWSSHRVVLHASAGTTCWGPPTRDERAPSDLSLTACRARLVTSIHLPTNWHARPWNPAMTACNGGPGRIAYKDPLSSTSPPIKCFMSCHRRAVVQNREREREVGCPTDCSWRCCRVVRSRTRELHQVALWCFGASSREGE